MFLKKGCILFTQSLEAVAVTLKPMCSESRDREAGR